MLDNYLASLMNQTYTGEGLLQGARVEDIGASARTDTAGVPTGQLHFYIDGSTIKMQIFDGAAWRTATFS